MQRLFSAPTTVNFELTEICNVKCRHCYNPWRDESMGENSVDNSKVENEVKKEVVELCSNFPIYNHLVKN